ncbi:MAG: hypothetical protein JWP26_51 [Devosia sp.]|uniref:hypothetical protein n=1 Tax=Devosia sp. TaxID=1871048 RepID=UPI00262A774C|nr:hypothetical protein [Devosia sp.]MDB5585081.1 hypothetical protein [Devosia sp.]
MDDEFELIEQGAAAFSAAKTRLAKRAALVNWLNGAVAFAEQVAPGAGAPGQHLIGALNALDAGMTPVIFDGTDRTPAELDALARAVAATLIFSAVGKRKKIKKPASQARELVRHYNGMNLGSLKGLCGHVGAGLAHIDDGKFKPDQRHLPVIQRIPVVNQGWKDREAFAATWSLDFNLYDAICYDLLQDRRIFVS